MKKTLTTFMIVLGVVVFVLLIYFAFSTQMCHRCDKMVEGDGFEFQGETYCDDCEWFVLLEYGLV